MNRLKLRYLIAPSLSLLVIAACSSAATDPVEEDGGVALDASGGQDSAVVKDSGKDSAVAQDSGKDSSFQTDSSTVDSSTRDGATEGGSDAGADSGGAPVTGTACTTVGFIYTKKCGLCGTAEAACEADMKVGTYGVCTGEVADGCTPGTTRSSACGLCGTKSEICQNNCQWASGSCSGEPAGACSPGAVKYTTAGCTMADTYRKQVCGSTCQFGAPEPPPCKPKDIGFPIGSAVGSVTSGDFQLSDVGDELPNVVTGSPYSASKACPLTLDTATDYYAYVTIKNPNATAAKVDVWLEKTGTSSSFDSLIAVYPTMPAAGARAACVGAYNDDCDYSTAGAPLTAFTTFSCLFGTSAVSIPAGGSVVLYVGASAFASLTAKNPFTVKTKVRSL